MTSAMFCSLDLAAMAAALAAPSTRSGATAAKRRNFETLNKAVSPQSLRKALPAVDGDKAYDEFEVAGEPFMPGVPGGESG